MKRRMTDAEVEQTVDALLDGVAKSPNRPQWVEMMGEESTAAFQRLCKRLMPEVVRWTAAEFNAAEESVAVTTIAPATAAFAAWMIANHARNTAEPEVSAQLMLNMAGLMTELLVGGARVVEGATLDPMAPARTM